MTGTLPRRRKVLSRIIGFKRLQLSVLFDGDVVFPITFWSSASSSRMWSAKSVAVGWWKHFLGNRTRSPSKPLERRTSLSSSSSTSNFTLSAMYWEVSLSNFDFTIAPSGNLAVASLSSCVVPAPERFFVTPVCKLSCPAPQCFRNRSKIASTRSSFSRSSAADSASTPGICRPAFNPARLPFACHNFEWPGASKSSLRLTAAQTALPIGDAALIFRSHRAFLWLIGRSATVRRRTSFNSAARSESRGEYRIAL
mmetsp:Transcript_72218/g.200303  ORF Transcript_72218/g.200303 Transcript_72218/m.200303 type:complete len:254 (-) Transcript_72218:146-907(-)